MGQRIDVKHLNIYYGDFLAVEDVNINIEPNKTVLRIISLKRRKAPSDEGAFCLVNHHWRGV